MRKHKSEIDMTRGSIFENVIRFVIPLILGNILQLLYNAADLIVVSRFAGSDAMASVGATSSLNTLVLNFCVGLSIGAGVVVARKYGAKDAAGVRRAVHTTVFLSLAVGVIALVVGLLISAPMLRLMGTPEGRVFDGAVLYIRIIFLCLPGTLVYNFGASVLRGVGDTKRPLYILALTGIVNVILNLVLVIVFHMDVVGVAIATGVSNYLSAFAVIYALIHTNGMYRLTLSKIRAYKEEILEILKIGVPSGIQSTLFAVANVTIQSGVNSFGKAAIAGGAAGSNIEGFVYTAMNAFSQATVTAVGQNYGAKNEKRVYTSMYTLLACTSVVGALLGAITVLFARPLLRIYITDSPEAIDFGVIRMIYTGLPYFLCGMMEVMSGVLRGLGYSTLSTVNSLVGACGLRLLWIALILPLHHTIEMLFLCWPISWVVVVIVHYICFLCVRKKAFQKMYAA